MILLTLSEVLESIRAVAESLGYWGVFGIVLYVVLLALWILHTMHEGWLEDHPERRDEQEQLDRNARFFHCNSCSFFASWYLSIFSFALLS